MCHTTVIPDSIWKEQKGSFSFFLCCGDYFLLAVQFRKVTSGPFYLVFLSRVEIVECAKDKELNGFPLLWKFLAHDQRDIQVF